MQGLAGAYDLQFDFVQALRQFTSDCGALLIADEVQCGIGRSGRFFAAEAYAIEPDLLTSAKALGGGIPCGAVLCSEVLASHCGHGDLGTTFGGGPVACAAMLAVLDTIADDDLLQNVRNREIEIREQCITGPVQKIRGMGLLLGLVCDQPANTVRDVLLDHDILTGTSSDPHVLRILAPLIIEPQHVRRLAAALSTIAAVAS